MGGSSDKESACVCVSQKVPGGQLGIEPARPATTKPLTPKKWLSYLHMFKQFLHVCVIKKRYLQSEFFLFIFFLFPSRWTFNPAVLKKLSVGEAPPRLSLVMPEDPFMFQPGHFVKVNSDQDAVKQQQAGHGDWVPAMEMVRRGDVNGKDYQPISALTHSSVS